MIDTNGNYVATDIVSDNAALSDTWTGQSLDLGCLSDCESLSVVSTLAAGDPSIASCVLSAGACISSIPVVIGMKMLLGIGNYFTSL